MAQITRRSILVLLLIAATSVAFAQAPAGQSGGAALPKRASEVLDKRFKDWRLASVEPGTDSCLKNLAGQSPSFAEADLTGDGTIDYALQIATTDGVLVVALIGRLRDFTVNEVVPAGPASNRVLEIRKRGTRFREPGAAVDDFFGADTITLTECGKATTAYLWTGAEFRATPLIAQ
jgi:hypothetical protein